MRGLQVTGADALPGGPVPSTVDCAVLVVAYRSAEDLPALLDSLPAAADGLRLAVTVVDNASGDAIADVLAGRDVQLVLSSRNLGYAAGINLASAHAAAGPWVLVLNPDVVLSPGAVRALVDAAERTGADAAVPRLVDASGRVARSLRREPTLGRAFGEAVLGDHLGRRPGWLSEVVREPEAYEREHEVDWATGAVLLVRRSAVAAVGDWDSRWFLYSEETDYLRRLRENGGRVVYTPRSTARHRGGGSGTSRDLVALLEVNRVRYFAKWHSRPATAAFGGAVVLSAVLRARRPESRRALHALVSPRVRRSLPGQGPVPPPPGRGRTGRGLRWSRR